jgi:hypothetical protein
MYSKCVDKAMADEDRCVDTNCIGRSRLKSALDRGGGGNQSSASKADTSRNRKLPQWLVTASSYEDSTMSLIHLTDKVKPPSKPREERRMLFRGQHCSPKVGATACGNCRDNLGHTEAHEESHKGDYIGHCALEMKLGDMDDMRSSIIKRYSLVRPAQFGAKSM